MAGFRAASAQAEVLVNLHDVRRWPTECCGAVPQRILPSERLDDSRPPGEGWTAAGTRRLTLQVARPRSWTTAIRTCPRACLVPFRGRRGRCRERAPRTRGRRAGGRSTAIIVHLPSLEMTDDDPPPGSAASSAVLPPAAPSRDTSVRSASQLRCAGGDAGWILDKHDSPP